MRAQYRPDLVFEQTGIASVTGFLPFSLDTADELRTIKSFTELNLGRALLPSTNTMLFMRFIGDDGVKNLLWSLSFDAAVAKEKFGPLPPTSNTYGTQVLIQEMVRRLKDTNCCEGKVLALFQCFVIFHMLMLRSDAYCSFHVAVRAVQNGKSDPHTKHPATHRDSHYLRDNKVPSPSTCFSAA